MMCLFYSRMRRPGLYCREAAIKYTKAVNLCLAHSSGSAQALLRVVLIDATVPLQ